MPEQDRAVQRLAEVRGLVDQVRAVLEGGVRRLGFDAAQVSIPEAGQARLQMLRDSYDGADSLECSWCDERGYRRGSMLFHADGSFWAEYDVALPHPSDRRWFVEAMTAWGSADNIKSEPRMLPTID